MLAQHQEDRAYREDILIDPNSWLNYQIPLIRWISFTVMENSNVHLQIAMTRFSFTCR